MLKVMYPNCEIYTVYRWASVCLLLDPSKVVISRRFSTRSNLSESLRWSHAPTQPATFFSSLHNNNLVIRWSATQALQPLRSPTKFPPLHSTTPGTVWPLRPLPTYLGHRHLLLTAVPSPCCSSSRHSGDLAVLLLMDCTLSFLPREGLAGSLPSCDPMHHASSSPLGTYHHPSGLERVYPPPGHLGEQLGESAWPSHHPLVSSKAATRLLPVGPAARHCHPPCTWGSD